MPVRIKLDFGSHVWLFGAALFLPLQAGAGTPSFLCSRANTWIEKTICASDHLSALDLDMAAVYSRSLRIEDPATVRSIQVEQHKWWGERAQCQKDADPPACVERTYNERISALKSLPTYPGDKPIRAPRIGREVAIKEVGQGWSRELSEYYKAIKLCTTKWKTPVRTVLKAWREERGETISMWLRSSEDEYLLCTASRNGQELKLLRPQESDEEPPTSGPVLHLSSPGSACKTTTPVLDPQGREFGWLSAEPCAGS